MAKTIVRLNVSSSIWPVVEQWAGQHNYALETSTESTRLYLRNSEEANAQIHVALSQDDEHVQIQAWFSDLIRKELEIDSSSFYAALPRKEAVSEINNLIATLGVTPPKKAETTQKGSLAFNLGRSIRKISGKK
jgi:hypothetical protein